jgi:TonB family protein
MNRLLPIVLALILLCQGALAQSIAGEGATTTLALGVNAEGTVKRVEIRKSCDRRECDVAAMSRAFALQFPPALEGTATLAPRLFLIGAEVAGLTQ